MRIACVFAIALVALCQSRVLAIPSHETCSRKMIDTFDSRPQEFAYKMLACQVRGSAGDECCAMTKSVFGYGGPLRECLCDSGFFSMVVDSVPNAGFMPDFTVDMWKQCGIPVSGSDKCPGTDGSPAVTNHGMVKKALAAKAMLKKAISKGSLAKGGLMNKLLSGHEEQEEQEVLDTSQGEEHQGYETHSGDSVLYVAVKESHPEVVEVPGPPVPVPGPTVEVPVPVPGPPEQVPVPVPVPVPGPPVEVPVEVPGPPVEVPVPVPVPVEPKKTGAEATPLPPVETPPMDGGTPQDFTIPPPGEDKLTGGQKIEPEMVPGGGDQFYANGSGGEGGQSQGFVEGSAQASVDGAGGEGGQVEGWTEGSVEGSDASAQFSAQGSADGSGELAAGGFADTSAQFPAQEPVDPSAAGIDGSGQIAQGIDGSGQIAQGSPGQDGQAPVEGVDASGQVDQGFLAQVPVQEPFPQDGQGAIDGAGQVQGGGDAAGGQYPEMPAGVDPATLGIGRRLRFL